MIFIKAIHTSQIVYQTNMFFIITLLWLALLFLFSKNLQVNECLILEKQNFCQWFYYPI